MKSYLSITIISLLLGVSTSHADPLTRDSAGNINFKGDGYSFVVNQNGTVTVNELVGECGLGKIFKKTDPQGNSIKCVGENIKLADAKGNKLKVAGKIAKGQTAAGEEFLLGESSGSVIAKD